ncbi:aldose 1-epimerase [Ramlibacter algicola]|uniref:Aldose 1-epimerase n=1 Tax=Ramlibacter algicola TaxID=2795217 RepID=A0A934PYP5_9BURK|nr:aldose 1-epimerase [Ramlibacter algicola]MBK0391094.1 aldose 1-epimerase [Ramlibacter algicola]
MHETIEVARALREGTHPLLQLQAGELRAAITPEVGGSLASFSREWKDGGRTRELHWLRPASDEGLANRNPLAMASFPLVPYCNRIRGGRAHFGDRDVHAPPNHPAEDSPHPLHGIGWQRAWVVEVEAAAEVILRLEVPAGPAWPWAFSARQAYVLSPDRLEIAIAVRNEDTVPMPVGIGHHPYFPHEPGTRLATQTRAIWEADDEVMPTRLDGSSAVVRQLREGADLSQLHTDNNFTGWSREARIDWPASDHGPERSLVMTAEAPLDFFVLYRQRGYDYFCAEPVSQCTDWLNLQDRYATVDLGGAVLAPGQGIAARFWLKPQW